MIQKILKEVKDQSVMTKAILENPNKQDLHLPHLQITLVNQTIKGLDLALEVYKRYNGKVPSPIQDEINAMRYDLMELRKSLMK